MSDTLIKKINNFLGKSNLFESSWGRLSDKDDQRWEKLTDQYMPDSGKADTVGGEIIRAMNRLVYRYYNDGDTVDDYGGNTFNILIGADKYLLKQGVNGYRELRNFPGSLDDYEVALCKNLKATLDYLLSRPSLFDKENNKDFMDLGEKQEWKEDEDEEYYEEDDDEYVGPVDDED